MLLGVSGAGGSARLAGRGPAASFPYDTERGSRGKSRAAAGGLRRRGGGRAAASAPVARGRRAGGRGATAHGAQPRRCSRKLRRRRRPYGHGGGGKRARGEARQARVLRRLQRRAVRSSAPAVLDSGVVRTQAAALTLGPERSWAARCSAQARRVQNGGGRGESRRGGSGVSQSGGSLASGGGAVLGTRCAWLRGDLCSCVAGMACLPVAAVLLANWETVERAAGACARAPLPVDELGDEFIGGEVRATQPQPAATKRGGDMPRRRCLRLQH